MAEKLRTKDLLNLGIFGTIYMVVMAIAGVSGAAAPGLVFGTMVVAAFVNGTVFMLYLTRVDRFGMVVVLGLIMSLIMLAVGRAWTTVLTALVFGLLAELILALTKYRNTVANIFAYAVFTLWFIGPLLPMIWFTDDYFESVSQGNGANYAREMMDFFTVPVIAAFGASVFVAGALGAWLGSVLIKRHFAKAGIVSGTSTQEAGTTTEDVVQQDVLNALQNPTPDEQHNPTPDALQNPAPNALQNPAQGTQN